MCLNIVKNWSINGNLHKTFIVIVSKTEFSQSLRHQRSVGSRCGKLRDSKAQKYVEYRQKRNSWNKLAVNKWCRNENFGAEYKSLLYFYLYFAPLKWFNARAIYRDSSIHVRLEITRFKRKFIDWFLNKSFPNKDAASLCKMSIFKTLFLITSFEI